MRFNEFDLTEDQQRDMLRRKYPHLTEEQLDEILPAIAAGVARAGMAIGGAALRGGAALARGAAKGGAALARGAAKGGAALARGTGRVGAKMGQSVAQGTKASTRKAGQKAGQKAMSAAQKQLLKRGEKLVMPTDTPGSKPAEFEIDSVKGDEVVINNPKPKPGEPLKTVYKKKDLDPIIKQQAGL